MELFICYFNTEFESFHKHVCMITADENKARTWCDEVMPTYENSDLSEWRSYSKITAEQDYFVKEDGPFGLVEIDVPEIYINE